MSLAPSECRPAAGAAGRGIATASGPDEAGRHRTEIVTNWLLDDKPGRHVARRSRQGRTMADGSTDGRMSGPGISRIDLARRTALEM
jgi:hypothetical protein